MAASSLNFFENKEAGMLLESWFLNDQLMICHVIDFIKSELKPDKRKSLLFYERSLHWNSFNCQANNRGSINRNIFVRFLREINSLVPVSSKLEPENLVWCVWWYRWGVVRCFEGWFWSLVHASRILWSWSLLV